MNRSLLRYAVLGAFAAAAVGRLLMLGADGTADSVGQWMAILGFAVSAVLVAVLVVLYRLEGHDSRANDRPTHTPSRSSPR